MHVVKSFFFCVFFLVGVNCLDSERARAAVVGARSVSNSTRGSHSIRHARCGSAWRVSASLWSLTPPTSSLPSPAPSRCDSPKRAWPRRKKEQHPTVAGKRLAFTRAVWRSKRLPAYKTRGQCLATALLSGIQRGKPFFMIKICDFVPSKIFMRSGISSYYSKIKSNMW